MEIAIMNNAVVSVFWITDLNNINKYAACSGLGTMEAIAR